MADSNILSLISTTDTNLLEELEQRIDIIKHKLKFLENKPTVACIGSIEPLSAAGNWIPELVGIAGGIVALTPGSHELTWQEIQTADPDIIILIPRGFSMDSTLKEVGLILNKPGFGDLKAVKNNRFYIADGEKYFNHSGPNVVDSLEILAEIINPKQFVFGYEGESWMKFSV